MRPGFLNSCLLTVYILTTSAPSTRTMPPPEPSCEELRAMWRFSKRQSRATEKMNVIPTYKDPFAYNTWPNQARTHSMAGSRLQRPLVYGRIIQNFQRPKYVVPEDRVQWVTNNRDLIVRNSGSYQLLKSIVQAERAKEIRDQQAEEVPMSTNNQDYPMANRRKLGIQYFNTPYKLYRQTPYPEAVLVSCPARLRCMGTFSFNLRLRLSLKES